MALLIKMLGALLAVVGNILFAWNYRAADEGDKKAKKNTLIGMCLFLVGALTILTVVIFG